VSQLIRLIRLTPFVLLIRFDKDAGRSSVACRINRRYSRRKRQAIVLSGVPRSTYIAVYRADSAELSRAAHILVDQPLILDRKHRQLRKQWTDIIKSDESLDRLFIYLFYKN